MFDCLKYKSIDLINAFTGLEKAKFHLNTQIHKSFNQLFLQPNNFIIYWKKCILIIFIVPIDTLKQTFYISYNSIKEFHIENQFEKN